jgi:SAM-dependent methyltransferase
LTSPRRWSTTEDIQKYYRKHDLYGRYTFGNRTRVSQIRKIFLKWNRHFGRAVLDLACGGGILGFVVEAEEHQYLGIDINPDMITSARQEAAKIGSKCTFALGDVRSSRIKGTFHTVTLLGNAVIHFTPADLQKTLGNIKENVSVGAYFLVEYRDVVRMLYTGDWGKRYVEEKGKRSVVSVSKGIDTERGRINVESISRGKHNLDFGHALWSPFILEQVMNGAGWELARRQRTSPQVWFDVYQKK